MEEAKVLLAVKAGLKGERDSVTVYEEAAERSEGEVKAFFLERAGEERRHYDKLLEVYAELRKGRLAGGGVRPLEPVAADRSPSFVTAAFLKRVAESRYLSAAVSSAVLLEATALRHYRDAAEAAAEAGETGLRGLFLTLADWEDSHYRELLRLQEESTRLWFDEQRFEPF
jgi:rubrerythrin